MSATNVGPRDSGGTVTTELVENTKIYSEELVNFLLCSILLFTLIGKMFSHWFFMGGATIYVVLKIYALFAHALLFKESPMLSGLLVMMHIPFIFIVSYVSASLNQGVPFFLGIIQLVPVSIVGALVYQERLRAISRLASPSV